MAQSFKDLRLLSPEDCSFHHSNAFPEGPWSAHTFENLFSLKTVFGECLFLDSEFQGLYCFQAESETCDVLTFFISKPMQNKGMGSVLLKQMVAKARSLGIFKIFLEVNESNIPAQKLYQKEGFLPIGIRKNYYSQKGNISKNALTFCLLI